MNASPDDPIAEIWAIKDALSAKYGHDLNAMCRAIYAEQEKRPGDFVNLGGAARESQAVPPTVEAIGPPKKIAA